MKFLGKNIFNSPKTTTKPTENSPKSKPPSIKYSPATKSKTKRKPKSPKKTHPKKTNFLSKVEHPNSPSISSILQISQRSRPKGIDCGERKFVCADSVKAEICTREQASDQDPESGGHLHLRKEQLRQIMG